MTKPTKWLCTQQTQISLGIRPVWSESSLCSQWVAKDPSFLHADSEDWSDWADAQADLSLHWAHMPFCWFCHELAHFVFNQDECIGFKEAKQVGSIWLKYVFKNWFLLTSLILYFSCCNLSLWFIYPHKAYFYISAKVLIFWHSSGDEANGQS